MSEVQFQHSTDLIRTKAYRLTEWIFGQMYTPRGWSQSAAILAAALAGEVKPLYEASAEFIELDPNTPPETEMAHDAVMCTDIPKPSMSKDAAIAAIIKEMESTWGSNAIISTAPAAGLCHHWPVVGKERFSGPFNHTVR